MKRDGGAECRIWRQIRHLISCMMTCAGGISARRPPTRCRPMKSGKMKSPRGANLQTIAKNELAPYSEVDERRIQIYGPPLLLAPDVAQAMAMTLHELATNAAKYGGLSAPEGRINLKWSRDGARLTLQWTEIGGPTVQKPTRRGFGGQIIERMIDQLNGKIDFEWRADELVCQIIFDMPP